jgi:hypothetical protein
MALYDSTKACKPQNEEITVLALREAVRVWVSHLFFIKIVGNYWIALSTKMSSGAEGGREAQRIRGMSTFQLIRY